VDVVFMAAGYSGSVRYRIWNSDGTQCDGRRQRVASDNKSVSQAYQVSGACVLVCSFDQHLRYLSVVHAVSKVGAVARL